MFQWKDEYSCNVTAIDNQHKHLFVLVAELYDIAKSKDDFDYYDDINRIFNELSDYTVYHFQYEEQLMAEYSLDPAEIKRHKFEHAGFIAKMIKVQKEDLDKRQKKVLMDVIMFATDWISDHILNSDMKYKDHFNSKGLR